MKVVASLLLLLCWSIGLQAAGEGGEGGSSTPMSPCAVPHERLNSIIRGLFPENYNISINCLSFERTSTLKRGVVSGLNETGGSGLRMVLSCVEEAIVAQPSALPPSSRSMTTTACIECTDTAVEADICGTRK